MGMMGENDAAAVRRVRAGDKDAFRVLVERHSRSIFRLAYRITGREQDAEDLVQDTLLRAFQQLDRFEARSSFGTWLYRIAVNCSLDLLRKRRPREESLDSSDSESEVLRIANGPLPDRLVFSTEVQGRIEAALNRLTPVERAAFVLRHFEEMPVKEVGQALGLGTGPTKNTLFRAVQKIRRILEPMVKSAR
jgi:RNA polymerase sigma-70 factor (ECF subfamily)